MNKIITTLLGTSVLLSCANAEETKLNDVLVSAKVKSEAIDTAGSFNIVDQEDIKTSNAQSIQNILEETVGINVSANSRSINGRKNITFRGMNPEHTAILIDGKRISNTDAQIGHSDFQYNWIPLSAISKMEIIRGPMSSLYGSKALGGVVNVITKKPNEDVEGNIETKYSTPNKQGENLDLSVVLSGKVSDKLTLSAFAQKQFLEKVDNNKNKDLDSAFEGKDITNVMLNGWYSIDDSQEVSFSALKGNEKRSANTIDFINTMKTFKLQRKDFDKFYDIDKEHYSLAYSKFFDESFLNVKAYSTKSDVYSESFQHTHKLKDDTLSAEMTFENFEDHYLVVGADLRKESYKKAINGQKVIKLPIGINKERKEFSNNITYKSLYFQDEINVNDDLLLTMGARYDKHEKFGGEFSPKIFGVYKTGENSRLKVGYGRGFNAPTLTQLSSAYKFVNPSAGHAFKGNDNLKPEISDTIELGYEYNNQKDSLLKATVFYTKLKDLISEENTSERAGMKVDPITGNPKGPLYYSLYSNIGKTDLKGLELEYVKNNLLDNLDFNFFYTYLDAKDRDKNRELNFRPKHKINTSLKYHFDKTLSANLSVAYTGKQVNYDDVEKTFTHMHPFVTSKLQVSKDFNKKLNVRVGINNLTNEQLDDGFNYQLRPRTFYTNLTYKF